MTRSSCHYIDVSFRDPCSKHQALSLQEVIALDRRKKFSQLPAVPYFQAFFFFFFFLKFIYFFFFFGFFLFFKFFFFFFFFKRNSYMLCW